MKRARLNDLTIRSAAKDDIDGVCELINAYSMDIHGVSNDAKRNVEMTWGQPGFRVDTDTRVAVTSEGRIVGYGEVEDTEEPHVRVGSWMRVHPEFREHELDATLLAWIEERAHEAIAQAPEGARVTLSQGVPDADAQAQELLKDSGYNAIRHFIRMTIELDGDIPEPDWPEGVAVRTLVLDEDLEDMVNAFRDSFQDHWGHIEKPFEEELKEWDYWIRNDEQFDQTLTFLVVAGDKIAGFSLSDPKFSEDPDMGYVDVLAVRRAWRRQGIALALLHHSFQEFQRRGQKRVGLDVDAASLTGAHKLYEVAGMKPTRQINLFEKELRAGKDLSLQTLGGDCPS